jgi:DNA-binding transcriptional ArsR family regulator
VDSIDAKVFSHPLRVRILGALGVQPASAMQLSRDLSQPLGKVAYHLSVLCDTGYVEPVEGQDPRTQDPLYESARS